MTDPAPLTPPNCDLRDFPSLMLDANRLFGSEFNALASADPLAWMCGVKLWLKSWHQVPAASLPVDDALLAHLAELSGNRRAWAKVRDLALRGWIRCGDRLYHPLIAEKALECWIDKLHQRVASGLGHAKRWKVEFDRASLDAEIEAAAALLTRLNPKSRVLLKHGRRPAEPSDDGGPDDATGMPPPLPPPLPKACQGKGREGSSLEPHGSKTTPDPQRRSGRRSRDERAAPDPPVAVPDPFPDPDIRAAVVAHKGEPFARSYLDGAIWRNGADREIRTSRKTAAIQLNRECGELLRRLDVRAVHHSEETTT